MVVVDMVIFTFEGDTLKVLLIKRKASPFVGKWAIPGGFVRKKESLQRAAEREHSFTPFRQSVPNLGTLVSFEHKSRNCELADMVGGVRVAPVECPRNLVNTEFRLLREKLENLDAPVIGKSLNDVLQVSRVVFHIPSYTTTHALFRNFAKLRNNPGGNTGEKTGRGRIDREREEHASRLPVSGFL